MVSLADLRARNVQPVWQESVAIVQELIQSATSSGTPLPDLEHVALIPNGDVVAMPGSPEPTDPVKQAATMLRVLVDGVATPPELEEFIRKNLSGANAVATLADFARGLSFYERPGRRADVERLVARAAAAEQLTRADEELKRLKEKAAEATDNRLEETIFMDTVATAMQRRRNPALVAVAGVVVVAAIVGGAWWWWRDRTTAPQPSASAAATNASAAATADKSSTPTPATADKSAAAVANAGAGAPDAKSPAAAAADAATPGKPNAASAPGAAANAPAASSASSPEPSLLDRATAAVQSAVNRIVGPPPAPENAAAPAPVEPPPAPPKKTHHKKPAPKVPAESVADTAVPAVAKTESIEPAPTSTPVPVAAVAVPEDETIYGTSDSAVTPPVLVRPVLPKDPPPGVPLDQIGTIEVLVDEQGDVEQVHLISPANRFHERMLVSAAKMWKFRPAFKDGHPVRYRTKVRLTV